jgi:hypothetical protein
MGLLGKIGDVFQKIDYHVSNDPEIVGKRFEDHVQNLFSIKFFKLIEKTHSFKTNTERYVESSLNPDLIFEHIPTGNQFAIECKYRTKLNQQGQLEWSNPEQLKRYRAFEYQRKIPVYVVIGYVKVTKQYDRILKEYYENIEKYMYVIPLKEAKYPALYKSVFSKFEREYDGQFFWIDGILY